MPETESLAKDGDPQKRDNWIKRLDAIRSEKETAMINLARSDLGTSEYKRAIDIIEWKTMEELALRKPNIDRLVGSAPG